ncbi:MAG: M20 family metallo-hydrolase [Deinococcales bacterium]
MKINIALLEQELRTLATFSDAPAPAVTRVLWTQKDMEMRAYFKNLALEAGLLWREDALGNTFIRLEGSEPALPAIGTGSHNDAIPFSGMYDGTVGVMGGLEALRAIKRSGIAHRRSLEVLMFTAEEPTRFGLGCLGSRLMTGAISLDAVRALRDTDGLSLEEARQKVGYTAPLETVRLPDDYYAAFIELHIEQAPLLEQQAIQIGVVNAIAAPSSFFVHLRGEGGHAGTRLMPGRRDALLAAAEIALAVETAALSSGAVDTVGTTGILEVHPGAINSIPSQIRMGIDIRDTDLVRRDRAVQHVLKTVESVCQKRNIAHRLEMLNADPPARSAPQVLAAIRAAVGAMQVSSLEMVSRAYHDSLFMARVFPVAMIFIPCRGGVSHRPDEYATPEDIARGVEVLARTMLELANQ